MPRLADLVRHNRLSDLNVPSGLQGTVREILLEDPNLTIAASWASLPWLIRRLIEVAGVDSSTGAALARHGIVTLSDLESALRDGRVGSHFSSHQEHLQLAAQAGHAEETASTAAVTSSGPESGNAPIRSRSSAGLRSSKDAPPAAGRHSPAIWLR